MEKTFTLSISLEFITFSFCSKNLTLSEQKELSCTGKNYLLVYYQQQSWQLRGATAQPSLWIQCSLVHYEVWERILLLIPKNVHFWLQSTNQSVKQKKQSYVHKELQLWQTLAFQSQATSYSHGYTCPSEALNTQEFILKPLQYLESLIHS